MQLHTSPLTLRHKLLRIGLPLAAIAATAFLLRSILYDVFIIVFGASAVAFLLEPLARIYEKRLSRNSAALAALLSVTLVLLAALGLLLPLIIRQFSQLAILIPDAISLIRNEISDLYSFLESRFSGLKIPSPSFDSAPLPEIAAGTLDLAGSIAGFAYRFSLMVVLSYFLLCSRSALMIRLELLIPQSMRRTAVRMGNAVCRELKLYLRGQGMIAIAVGTLSAAGLALVGVPSSLVLGGFVGLLNMIPYFGPILGGIPAVLIALSESWQTALYAAAILWIVQQLDSTFISPRILGSLTGLSPGVVLLAIFAGSHFSGIVGMLLALPLVMAIRTVFRVFVQRHENV